MAVRNDGVPITSRTILSWGGFLVTVICCIVAIVWFFGGMSTKVATHDIMIASSKAEIDQLKDRTNKNEITAQETIRKLDRAITILERLDQKAGKP